MFDIGKSSARGGAHKLDQLKVKAETMSEFRFERLEQYRTGGTEEQMELAIPIPKSGSGKVHRECPSKECVPGLFQLGSAPSPRTLAEANKGLVRRLPATLGTTCPYCGVDAEDSNFLFEEDIDAAKEQVAWAAREDFAEAFREMFRGVGQQLRSGYLKIEVASNSSYTPPPFFYREDLLREVTCDICSRSYGVYAAAVFCPDCGARNIHVHFRREVELINQQIAVALKTGEDRNGELAYRLLGNAHEDVLTALEAYHKTIYKFLVRKRIADPQEVQKLCSKKHVGNAFQSVERGRGMYARFGIDPYDRLTPEELESLNLNVHKRHVLGHNLGMADEAYNEVVSRSEKVGQTVPILADEVTRFASICEAVVIRLEEECPEFLPPVEVRTSEEQSASGEEPFPK